MSELRKRQNRFKPKSEIEWLDRDSRKEHRRTIAVLTDLTMALEKRAVLTPAQDHQIRALTQSDAIDTRLNGMWDILEQTESAYLEKLAAMGPHDLSAYHEFVNPHEPPAEHHYFMCDHLMRVESGEIATLILALPPGAAKALALDTPIPTPNGWTTMGELKVGDKVFDENGEPCSVTWVSPVWKNRPVYKVETDCGDMIIADREHEWLVCRDRESGVFEIKETHALLPKWGKRPMVKRAKALVTDESDLPIDPYLLGVWLGDGTSASVSITSSTEDRVWLRSEIERLGYKTTDRAAKDLFGVVGVRDRFVSLGLLNDPHHKTHGRKHIPQAYMRASYRQRLALVQGMVDSDGTVCKRRGAATFCNINKELALSFRELVRSLGVKAGWSVGRAVFNGVDHGEVYRVSFYHEEAARMPRKAALCRNQSRTPNTYLEITPNGFADTVCIEVDSPSHLFLCGESMTPTHNSTYSSRTFAQWCLGRNPDWRVLACGHALALDTEVPTPHGFKTVESLKVGDEVFADDGSVTVVTAKSPVFTDHECFVATVGDQEIIVDAEHLWTLDASTLNALGERTVRSTAYLSKLRQNDFCGFRLVDNLPVHYAEKELIVEPYLLGLWLGDGLSEDGRIACEAGDKTELMGYIGEACNPTKNPNRFSVIGLAASLRDLSVLGDKHVPEIYKRGSIDQRWALIQGLMDSDGSVTKEGDCAFHNTNYGLIQAVREILFSLGVKNTVYAVPMRGLMTRPAWRVHFKNDRAFRLRRKKLRAKSSKKHRRVKFNATTRVPTQCITIAHPSKTFLVTRSYVPTHNSQKFCEDEFSKPNRTALDSPQFAAVFPDVQLNPMEKGASFWRLMGWRGSYACRGALAGTAGLRARIILGDDLFKNAADAMSEVVRSNIWRWWTADVMSRRLPNAPMVLVNTLWHSDDVPNKLKALSEENPAALPQPFVFINLPAEAGDDDPLGRRPGEWLWCKEQQDDGFYTINDYETKRATMPPSLWSALYLGQPLDRMGDYISEDQFHRYEKPPVNRQGHEMQWVKTVMSIDTASTGKDRADYTAILIFRKHVDGTHYLVDVWRDKVTLEKVVRVIAKLMRHWQVNHAIVEDSGMGAQLLENYQGKLPAPLVSYTPAGKGSKDFRFDAAAPWITSGKVLFPKEAPWLANFVNELVAFPNGANDDQVDAFSMYTDCELKTRAGGTKPLRMRG